MKILFPHSDLITSSASLELKQGEISKHVEPVIDPEYPWEGNLTYLYGSVLKTTLYRMWYQANGTDVGYARSRDGYRWEKPLVNKLSEPEHQAGVTVGLDDGDKEFCAPRRRASRGKSNLVSNLHMPSLVYDPADHARRYKLFGYTDQGYCAAFSKDGIHFRPADRNPVIPLIKFRAPNSRKTWFSDVAPVFKDAQTGKYVSHVKTYQCDGEGRVRRCVGYADSKDFLAWSEPVTLWTPTETEDKLAREKGFQWADFYGLCAFNYGDSYLGLLWLFLIDYELERGTHEGKIEVFLASSPDGKIWKRVSDSPFLPLSRSGWDTGMITTANQPLFDKDKILIFYGGANFSHSAGEEGNPYEQQHRFRIGVATLRKDGFVYAANGSLITRRLDSKIGRVKINADSRSGKIFICVDNGKKTESFTINGIDAVDQTLHTSLKGEVVLRVSIENAKLYSIELR